MALKPGDDVVGDEPGEGSANSWRTYAASS